MMPSFFLSSAKVRNFGSIESAELRFGSGLNVLYGPNDLGKSTLAASIRCALLASAKSTLAKKWRTWGGEHPPSVELTFVAANQLYRLTKRFDVKTGTALLEKTVGDTFIEVAKQSKVDTELRRLLSWGLPKTRRKAPVSFLAVSLLGEQANATQVFDVGFDAEDEQAAKEALTRALGAMASSSNLDEALLHCRKQVDAHFDTSGKHRTGQTAPLASVRAHVAHCESLLRETQELKEKQDTLRSRIAKGKSHIESLVKNKEQLIVERAVLTKKSETYKTLKAQQVTLVALREDLAEQQTALKTLGESQSSLQKQRDESAAALKSARAELERATKEEEQAKQDKQRVETLAKKIEKLESDHALAVNQLEQLERCFVNLQASQDALESFVVSLAETQTQVKAVADTQKTQQAKLASTEQALRVVHFRKQRAELDRSQSTQETLQKLNVQLTAKISLSELEGQFTTAELIEALRLDERLLLLEDLSLALGDSLTAKQAGLLRARREAAQQRWDAEFSQLPLDREDISSSWIALLSARSKADLEQQIQDLSQSIKDHDAIKVHHKALVEKMAKLNELPPNAALLKPESEIEGILFAQRNRLQELNTERQLLEQKRVVLEAQRRNAKEQHAERMKELEITISSLSGTHRPEIHRERLRKEVASQTEELTVLKKQHDQGKHTQQAKPISHLATELQRREQLHEAIQKQFDELVGKLNFAEEHFDKAKLAVTVKKLKEIDTAMLPLVQTESTLATASETLAETVKRLSEARTASAKEEGLMVALQVGGSVDSEEVLSMKKAYDDALACESNAVVQANAWKLLLEVVEDVVREEQDGIADIMGDIMSERFSELLQFIGRDDIDYGAVVFSAGLQNAGLTVGEQQRSLDTLSVGVREQLATILRLVVAETLQNTLLLDDQLTQTDSNRLTWFSRLLHETSQRTQIVVLTCRENEYATPKGCEITEPVMRLDLSKCIIRARVSPNAVESL